MNRQDMVAVFRRRLAALIAQSGVSQSAFAARAGLDRSTLSLLLSEANTRLPRAESLVQIAASRGASVDWLLGLSESAAVAPDIVAAPAVAPNADDPADAQLQRWHREARGQKVRYVPSTLPDQIKTEAVIAYECRMQTPAEMTAAGEIMHERIAHARAASSEIEVCSTRQSLEGFAWGQGLWRQLGLRDRRRQLEHIAALTDELYPNYRWFLFDGRACHASPYTLFGQRRAAVYMGSLYFVFTSTEVIRDLTEHFEALVRKATVQPNEVPVLARQLLRDIA
jgi:transcriptional regulator with XRE-family HTH domain